MNRKRFFFLCIIIICMVACQMNVSFTGGTIDPQAKTVLIGTFINNAALVNPLLSQSFTSSLKNKIQNQTPLTIVDNLPADYAFEGSISNYSIDPVAIQGNETAAMNRLTITVRVSFKNQFNEKLDFEQSFSRYAEYLSTQNFSTIENSLVEEITNALTDDIYNKAFVNW